MASFMVDLIITPIHYDSHILLDVHRHTLILSELKIPSNSKHGHAAILQQAELHGQ